MESVLSPKHSDMEVNIPSGSLTHCATTPISVLVVSRESITYKVFSVVVRVHITGTRMAAVGFNRRQVPGVAVRKMVRRSWILANFESKTDMTG